MATNETTQEVYREMIREDFGVDQLDGLEAVSEKVDYEKEYKYMTESTEKAESENIKRKGTKRGPGRPRKKTTSSLATICMKLMKRVDTLEKKVKKLKSAEKPVEKKEVEKKEEKKEVEKKTTRKKTTKKS